MTGFLLDTNVISELTKPRPEPRVTSWIRKTSEELLYLSVLTLGEIRKGIVKVAEPSRRMSLESWLDRDVVLRFAGRILAVDQRIADRWGQISGWAALRNKPIPVIDSLLAATALEHNLILVTRNTNDVAGHGAEIFNPWNDPPQK